MSPHDYRERDYAFGQAMLTLRTVMTLTQVELARSLGVSRGAVLAWEAGSSYPKVDRLKRFIEMGVKMRIFPAGRDEEEIRVLWQAAHQKVFLDEAWLSALLSPSSAVTSINEPGEAAGASVLTTALPVRGRRVVWEETPDIPSFYGREAELARLSQWVVWERCRVVCVLGLGGIVKSALSVTLMRQATERFEVVLFRSLRDAPTCEALLTDCLHVLSPRPRHEVSTRLEGRISLLLECLHERRVLLVLDNLEVLLQEGESLGRFRPGFEGYGQLLRRVAETGHQSCLLLTSREKPADLVPLEGTHSRVRSLRMAGLEQSACERLLAEKELVGTAEERARLAEAYIGNPLALKIVAETIADLFGGEVGQFLKQDTVIFGGIQELLAGQVSRLSAKSRPCCAPWRLLASRSTSRSCWRCSMRRCCVDRCWQRSTACAAARSSSGATGRAV